MFEPRASEPGTGLGRLVAIGVVRSAIRLGNRMPTDGVPATIEVFPPFAAALDTIDANSHVWVLGWFGGADRSALSLRGDRPGRGVFGLRSAARPNPIGLTPARLLAVDGLRLELDRLDFFDGTFILDLKRYSPTWDSIHCAVTSRDLRSPVDSLEYAVEWLGIAARFRGACTTDLVVGVRCLLNACATLQCGPRDPAVRFQAPDCGDVADAVQALSGATIGNSRLHVVPDSMLIVTAGGVSRRYLLLGNSASPEDALTLPLSQLASAAGPR